jgi:hypothetical protein
MRLLSYALAICMLSAPAISGSILFSDFGPSGDLYTDGGGWGIQGSASPIDNLGDSNQTANLFTVAGSGSLPLTQIDVAVGNVGLVIDDYSDPGTFYASIWTDSGGLPGAQVAGAYWSLTANTDGDCCSLISVTGITGIELTGGQQYFMILGPLNLADSSYDSWNLNNQGATDVVLGSGDGGYTWSGGDSTLGAFDLIGNSSIGNFSSVPEPNPVILFGAGLLLMLAVKRFPARKHDEARRGRK